MSTIKMHLVILGILYLVPLCFGENSFEEFNLDELEQSIDSPVLEADIESESINLVGEEQFSDDSLRSLLPDGDEWNINPSQVWQQPDENFIKHHGSLIDWQQLNTDRGLIAWLDIYRWKAQREWRDFYPDWRLRQREDVRKEIVGLVLSCIGDCRVYRGLADVKAQHLSQIYEGDEIITSYNGHAWILLMDGAMVRISPYSSVAFNEINFSKERAFYYIRLNEGLITYLPRKFSEYQPEGLAETDTLFLPLPILEASSMTSIRTYYSYLSDLEKIQFKKNSKIKNKAHYLRLNQLIKNNNSNINNLKNRALITTPNFTLDLFHSAAHVHYIANQEGAFELINQKLGLEQEKDNQAKLILRGLSKPFIKHQIEDQQTYIVSKDGKEYHSSSEYSKKFAYQNFIIKRIPSINIAREILLRDRLSKHLNLLDQPDKLMVFTNYKLWQEGDEGIDFTQFLNPRIDYFIEQGNVLETINLTSLERYTKDSSYQPFDFSRYYYHAQENYHHYLGVDQNELKSNLVEASSQENFYWHIINAKGNK